MNIRNNGILVGRLTKDVKMFQNADKSRKALVTIAVPNNYKDADGKQTSEYIQVEGFVPAEKSDGVYAFMRKGDLVAIGYGVKTNNYTDKTSGEEVYGQVLRINSIELLESKSVTDARAARAAAGETEEVDA